MTRWRDALDASVSTACHGELPPKRVRRPGPDEFMKGLFALQALVRAQEAGSVPEMEIRVTAIDTFLAPAEDDADTIPVPSNLLSPPPKPGGK